MYINIFNQYDVLSKVFHSYIYMCVCVCVCVCVCMETAFYRIRGSFKCKIIFKIEFLEYLLNVIKLNKLEWGVVRM